MDIGDVAFGVQFGERHRRFFKDISGLDSPRTQGDMELWEIARGEAQEEMIDEIHTMLGAICEKLGLK